MQTRGLGRRGKASSHGGRRWWLRGVGLPLALFALLLQAAVGFAHHHFDSPGKASGGSGIPAAQTALLDGDEGMPHVPAVPKHDLCLVCLAVHAAASPSADVPRIAARLDSRGPARPPAFAAIYVPPRAAAFESRGPPLG